MASKAVVTYRNIGIFSLIMFSAIVGVALIYLPIPIILASLLILVGLILLVKYPFLGALAYLVFEYAGIAAKFKALQPLQLGKLIALSTFIFWIFNSRIKGKIKLVSNKENWLIVFWLLLAFISVMGAVDEDKGFSEAIDFSKWILIYFMLINIINTKQKWLWFIAVYLLLNLKMSQFQIRGFIKGISAASNQSSFIREGVGAGVTGYFGNAGDFGVAMCVVAPYAYYAFATAKSKIFKIASLGMLFAFILSIIRSSARGNMLGLVAMALLFWVKSKRKFLVSAVIIAFLAIYWVTAPDIVKARFLSATASQKDNTATHRLELWHKGIEMLLTHPLLGVGFGNFGPYYSLNYYGGDMTQRWVPHNIFVQVASELGFPGLLCLIAIIVVVFITNYETRKLCLRSPPGSEAYVNFADAIDLSLVGYLVSGSFLAVLYYPHIFIIMVFAVSLHQIAKNDLENKFSQETLPST